MGGGGGGGGGGGPDLPLNKQDRSIELGSMYTKCVSSGHVPWKVFA